MSPYKPDRLYYEEPSFVRISGRLAKEAQAAVRGSRPPLSFETAPPAYILLATQAVKLAADRRHTDALTHDVLDHAFNGGVL
jgi:hypothetical protein